MRNFLLLLLLSSQALADVLLKNNGATVGPVSSLNCGANMSCTRIGATGTVTGPACPAPDAGYVVVSGMSSGSPNERALAAGNYTSINTATAGAVKIDWAHGLACAAGGVLTSSGGSAMVCTSSIATSTALAADPTDCAVNQYAKAIAANGNLTCEKVAIATMADSATLAERANGLAADPTICSLDGPSQVAGGIDKFGNASCKSINVDSVTGIWSGAKGGLGAAQPTCSSTQVLTCNGTSCACTTTVNTFALSHVRAKTATAGSYASGAVIQYATEDRDSLSEYSTTTWTFTAGVAGTYLANCALFAGNLAYNAGNSVQIVIQKNGANIAYGYRAFAPSAANWYLTSQASTTMELAAGNTVRCIVSHDRGGGAITLFTDSAGNFFTVDRIP